MPTREFERLLIANRGEIAIRIHRACAELDIRTIAIHSDEDRYALHRFKADEAYSLGEGGNPVGVYLDIPRILEIAEATGADAIHPGYGFLSERADFAEAVESAGIAFVGPPPSVLSSVGDKVSARNAAVAAGLPIIPGSPPIEDRPRRACEYAREIGFPVMVKASGRRRRPWHARRRIPKTSSSTNFEAARREAASGLRERRGLRREARHATRSTSRSRSSRTSIRQRRPPLRARLLDPAPPPEGRRARPRPEPRPQDLRREALRLRRPSSRAHVGYQQRRHRRVPGLRRRLLLHRDEPSRSGRAHGQRRDHRRRHRRLPDPRSQMGQTLELDGHLPGDASTPRDFAIQCRVTTENPENGFLPGLRPTSSPTARPVASASASTRATPSPARSSRPTTTRSSRSSRPAAATSRRRPRRARRAPSAEFRVRGVETNVSYLSRT